MVKILNLETLLGELGFSLVAGFTLEAEGEARRFEALLAEYRRAPEVTRSRLYLETMEEILPGVEKLVVEPNTVNMLPMLPLGAQAPGVGAGR